MENEPKKHLISPLPEKQTGFVSTMLNGFFAGIFMCFKISVSIWIYPLSWTLDLFNYVLKMARFLLAFIIGGLQGVFKSLGVGVFGQKIHYAVLKENGQYLKISNKTLQDVFTCQLYDYSIRKFLTIPNIDDDLRVTEIQFWSSTGLNYLSKNLGIEAVTGIHNSQEKLTKFQTKTSGITYRHANYSEQIQIPKQDVFIFFNRGRQKNPSYENYVDMIKILTFIKKNMSENGYAIVGNHFTAQGQIKVFEQLLDAFRLNVEMEEDITKNILHSRKVLNKIHKNRKIAWLIGRGKQIVAQFLSQCQLLNRIWGFLLSAAGLKQELSQYKIYILEHSS